MYKHEEKEIIELLDIHHEYIKEVEKFIDGLRTIKDLKIAYAEYQRKAIQWAQKNKGDERLFYY